VAASIIRGAASDTDLAARIGEHDFALLLDGPTTGQAAIAKAQQIVAQGLQHSSVLPPATTLRFHVATALLPDHELDANRCLQWLGEACNAMRADPRRAIRSLNF
jgi:GGDEF domain-containing protein